MGVAVKENLICTSEPKLFHLYIIAHYNILHRFLFLSFCQPSSPTPGSFSFSYFSHSLLSLFSSFVVSPYHTDFLILRLLFPFFLFPLFSMLFPRFLFTQNADLSIRMCEMKFTMCLGRNIMMNIRLLR